MEIEVWRFVGFMVSRIDVEGAGDVVVSLVKGVKKRWYRILEGQSSVSARKWDGLLAIL